MCLGEDEIRPNEFVEQKSDQWLKARKQHNVENRGYSASQIDKLLALRNLKSQATYYQYINNNQALPEIAEDQRIHLERGNRIEPLGQASIAGSFIPAFLPGRIFKEHGYHSQDRMAASPDGCIWREGEDRPEYVYEGKAPDNNNMYTTGVKYKADVTNIGQCLLNAMVLDAEVGTLLAYVTEESMTLFLVPRCDELMTEIHNEVIGVIDGPLPRRRSPSILAVTEKLKTFCNDQVVFLGEFPTRKVMSLQAEGPSEKSGAWYLRGKTISVAGGNSLLTPDKWETAVTTMHDIENHSFKLQRKAATQVIPFLLTNTTRQSFNNAPHAIPCAVAYAGKDFDTKYSRETIRNVKAKVRGVDFKASVLLTCSDGEFIRNIVEDEDGIPRTKLGFSKKYWNKVGKMTKAEMISESVKRNIDLDLNASQSIDRPPPTRTTRTTSNTDAGPDNDEATTETGNYDSIKI